MSSIATGMERRVPGREASRDEARRGCAPPALYVPVDSQLMSYLGQSTLGIVCKGEKSVRERESDTITVIIEQKKKKVI